MWITSPNGRDRRLSECRRLHRRVRRWCRRSVCTCGLRWPCPDSTGWTPGDPVPDGTFRGVVPNPALCGGTVLNLPQIGRAGRLTPGQRERSSIR
jgi:hypothetical protein